MSHAARVLTPTAAAGLAALLVGLGFGRFAYTAQVPGLIGEGWIDPSGTGPLAAANFAGYLIGALAGAPLARRFGTARVLRFTMIATAASLIAGMAPLGLVWLALARLGAGVGGAVLMVVAPTAVLRLADPLRRGATAGVVFTGIGLGIAASGTLIPILAGAGVAATWGVLGGLAAILAIVHVAALARRAGGTADAARARSAGRLPAVRARLLHRRRRLRAAHRLLGRFHRA